VVDKALFSSNKDDWETPQWLFDELNAEFDFNLDAAASEDNAKCEDYIASDGLTTQWVHEVRTYPGGVKEVYYLKGRVFVNPPYGRAVGLWVQKAHDEVEKGNAELVVMLLPSRTDTRWFHQYIYQKDNVEIRFLKGRLKFSNRTLPTYQEDGGHKVSPAPFPSMVVIFRPQYSESGKWE